MTVSELTTEDLKAKIAMVEKDLLRMQGEPGNERKMQVLSEYKEYLRDEIKELERANKS